MRVRSSPARYRIRTGSASSYLERSRDDLSPDRRPTGRGERARWGIGNYEYFRALPGNGVEHFRAALEMFREAGDLTMEAWSLHMLGTGLLRNGDVDGAHENVAHAIRHFHASGDAAGLTLTLDDMSAIAVAEGDLPRAARLRGAARNLTMETGAELAEYVEDTFETGVRPGVRSHMPSARPGPLWRGGCRDDAGRGRSLRARGVPVDRARGHDEGVASTDDSASRSRSTRSPSTGWTTRPTHRPNRIRGC